MRRASSSTLLAIIALAAGAHQADAQTACPAPKTTCSGANGYYASKDDLDRLTAVADPILKELRTCLDGAGGKAVTPALVIRWDPDGNPVSVKIDVPGHESLPCVAKASGKLSSLQNPRETSIRCEYGCAKPAPPAPVPAPVPAPSASGPLVFLPPGAQQPPPAQPPAAGQAQQPGAIPVVGRPGGYAAEPYAVRYEKVWYGWQGLIPDGVAGVLLAAGLLSETGGLTTTGLITYGLGFPIVHMAHGEVGRGFGSMGLRIMMPLVGAGIGAIAGLIGNRQDRGEGAESGAIAGAFIAGGGAVLIDAAALSWKSEKVEAAPRTGVSLSPRVSFGGAGAAVGLGGVF